MGIRRSDCSSRARMWASSLPRQCFDHGLLFYFDLVTQLLGVDALAA